MDISHIFCLFSVLVKQQFYNIYIYMPHNLWPDSYIYINPRVWERKAHFPYTHIQRNNSKLWIKYPFNLNVLIYLSFKKGVNNWKVIYGFNAGNIHRTKNSTPKNKRSSAHTHTTDIALNQLAMARIPAFGLDPPFLQNVTATLYVQLCFPSEDLKLFTEVATNKMKNNHDETRNQTTLFTKAAYCVKSAEHHVC